MSIASEIREYIADTFADSGTFTTSDVVSSVGIRWTAANVSVAMYEWANRNAIVKGYRLIGEGKPGGRKIWKLTPINGKKKAQKAEVETKESAKVESGTFSGEIIDRRGDGAFLVRSGVDIYKVERLEW